MSTSEQGLKYNFQGALGTVQLSGSPVRSQAPVNFMGPCLIADSQIINERLNVLA